MPQDRRLRYRDSKLYAVPDSLSQLQGPYTGQVHLRHSVLWAPGDGSVDISTTGGARMAHQALLAEGLVTDQVKGLNEKRLIELWPELSMDRRVRSLWETKFPELRRVA